MAHNDKGIVSKDNNLRSVDKKIVIEDILKKVLSTSIFKKVSLTVISSIIAYFFYILGYIFLYSYYFPGDVENKSIFQMYLKQVPFDLKVNVAIGVVLLIISISIVIPLINIYYKKDLIMNWVIFIILSIVYIKGINDIIASKVDNNFIPRILYITCVVSFIPLFLFSIIYDVKMWNEKPKRTGIIFFVVITILMLGCVLFNLDSIWASVIMFVLAAFINFLCNLKCIKKQGEVVVNRKNNNEGSKLNINMIPPILSLICAASLGFSVMLFQFVREIGSLAGLSKVQESQVIIKYEDGSSKPKELKGEIVVGADDKYYISSSESRRMIIIKSDKIIEIDKEDEY